MPDARLIGIPQTQHNYIENIIYATTDCFPVEPQEEDVLKPVIYRYHSENRPNVDFYSLDKDNKPLITDESLEDVLYFGFELEFDTRQIIAKRLDNKKQLIKKSNLLFNSRSFLYYMYDSSVRNGLEAISQPATFEYHLSNYEKYKELFSIIREHGFKSETYQSCGLHIHFNKDFYCQDLERYTVNLLYLIEKFWRNLVLLSRRNYSSIVRWADKYNKQPKATWDEYNGTVYHSHFSRYKALNLINYNTYEFRMYRGTLIVEDFFAILELTKNLIILAKTKTAEELQMLQWNEVINTSDRLIKYNKKCHRATAIKRLPSDLQNEP